MIFLPFHSWTNVSLCPHNSEAFVTLLSVTVRKDFNFLLALVSLSLVTDVWSCDPLTYWVREWVSEWATHAVSLCAPPSPPQPLPSLLSPETPYMVQPVHPADWLLHFLQSLFLLLETFSIHMQRQVKWVRADWLLVSGGRGVDQGFTNAWFQDMATN